MRHLRTLSLALIACAMAAVFASTASAALPEFAVTPNKFSVKSGAGELVGALTITCRKDTSVGKVAQEQSGEVKAPTKARWRSTSKNAPCWYRARAVKGTPVGHLSLRGKRTLLPLRVD